RLLALVEAAGDLEPRRRRPAAPPRRVDRDRVERLGAETPLVRQVEDPPPLEPGERLDLLEDRRPVAPVEMIEDVGREAEDLGELEDEEGPLLDARRPGQDDPHPRLVAQARQGARVS